MTLCRHSHKMFKLRRPQKQNAAIVLITFGITVLICNSFNHYPTKAEIDDSRCSLHNTHPISPKDSLLEDEYEHDVSSNGTNNKPIITEVTVVTAFFDIGQFEKSGVMVDSTKYFDWARKLKYLLNPLVVYTDSSAFRRHVEKVRGKRGRNTEVRFFDTSTSWAFQNNEQIKSLFDSPGYPKFKPNTVNSLYACAQHAKYEVLAHSVEEEIFDTKYYMWLDIGYFRNRKLYTPFYLEKPSHFDDSKIAMNLIDPKKHLNNQPKTIILGNEVWVGGGAVFGDKIHIAKFAKDFKRAVEFFLAKRMINTDQQMIYAMYTPIGRDNIRPQVQLQLYQPPQDWFYLGNSMVRETT